MLKNEQTIAKLSLEQKLNIIANVSALGGVSVEGQEVPFLSEIDFSKKGAWQDFPSFNNLCRSFNPQLIKQVAETLIKNYKDTIGANLVTLPLSNAKVSPYASGISEDNFLSGELTASIVSACKDSGVCAVANDPLLCDEDVKFSDIVANERIVKDYFFAPFNRLKKAGVSAVQTKEKHVDKEYDKFNTELLEQINCSELKVIHDASETIDTEKHSFEIGKFYKGLSVEELSQLHERYLRLMESFNAGEVALSDINSICEKGGALSTETIDQAVDKILDFTAVCVNASLSQNKMVDAKKLLKRTMIESTVLLKNQGALPISERRRVAVIGSLFGENKGDFINAIKNGVSKYLNITGFAEGYTDSDLADNGTITDAVRLASLAEVVVVGLGYDDESSMNAKNCRNTKLPAPQEALLQRLARTGAKIVAVLFGEREFDMSFASLCNAVIMAPSLNSNGMEALAQILFGKESPGGKLLNTAYINTEEHFERIYNYKQSGRNLVGPFYGYKHYDSAGKKQEYPFGFGLGYAKFKVSGIRIGDGEISVKVKNASKYTASETIQIFVGKTETSILRPKRELKAVAKVYLEPRDSTYLTFKIKDLDLGVYDVDSKKYVVESGAYTFYVGTSIDNILKVKSVYVRGDKVKQEEIDKKPSSYFQNYGNILDGKYYLEEPWKKSVKKGKLIVATAFTYLMTFLFLVYGYLDYINFIPTMYLGYLIGVAVVALPLSSIFILRAMNKKRIKNNLEKSKKMKKEKLESLDKSQISEEIPYEQLFVEEFTLPIVNVESESSTKTSTEKEEKSYNFDSTLTFTGLADEFIALCEKANLHIDHESMRSVFAGLASSRLLILDADDKAVAIEVINQLGKFFACPVVSESYDYVVKNGGDVMYSSNLEAYADGLTDVAKSLINSECDENAIRIMSIVDVDANGVKPFLAHVFRYIDQPTRELKLSVQSGEKEYNVEMPENVWFILTLKKDERIVDIPRYILDDLCHVELKARFEEVVETVEPVALKVEQPVEEDKVEEQAQAENEPTAETTEETEQVAVEVAEQVEAEQVVEEQIASEQVEQVVEEQVISLHKYQFERMIQNAERDYQLDENMWKRLDKIEELVNKANSSYRISSKQWQKIEKYASVYLSAGGEMEETLDSVMANQIVCGMLSSVVEGQSKLDDKFVNVVENVFGEGHAPRTIKKVKLSGAKI
jgi:beta-glucosidase